MSGRAGFVWDDALAEYDFGPGHPLAPIRVQLARQLSADLGLLDHVELLGPVEPADEELLRRVHDAHYIDAVRHAQDNPDDGVDLAHGLGTADCPVFPAMHRASARVAGATVLAAQAVHDGRVDHAINLAGGLHHAMPAMASGFCIYNDIAVAIAWLLDQGVERVAYIDVDVHHGDGVQQVFWNDPRVLTVSIHESPATLFPGTGNPQESGGPSAPGTAVNIALPAGTGDQGWLRALHGVVPAVLEAFDPQLIVSQHGVDTHVADPLAHLAISVDGQRLAFDAVHRWAHRFARGRWIAVGGGGYAWVDVVPRAWAHLVGIAAGRPVDPSTPLPVSYLSAVRARTGQESPPLMTDGRDPWPRPFEQGFHADDPIDAAVLATRAAVFPQWGLEVEPVAWF